MVVVDARDTDAAAADAWDVAAGPETSFEQAEMAMSESRNNGTLHIRNSGTEERRFAEREACYPVTAKFAGERGNHACWFVLNRVQFFG